MNDGSRLGYQNFYKRMEHKVIYIMKLLSYFLVKFKIFRPIYTFYNTLMEH